jgi:hypothetical protein
MPSSAPGAFGRRSGRLGDRHLVVPARLLSAELILRPDRNCIIVASIPLLITLCSPFQPNAIGRAADASTPPVLLFFSVFWLVISGVSWLAVVSARTPAWANEVYDWNIAGFVIAVAGGQNPIVISRTMAMTHLAIHDALNAINRRYEPYIAEPRAEPTASAENFNNARRRPVS